MPQASDDKSFVQRLLEGDEEAKQRFGRDYETWLCSAYLQLRRTTAGSMPELDVLQARVIKSVAAGYLELLENGCLALTDYIETLRAADLLLVAACLGDCDAAWRRLQGLIDGHVVPVLKRNWRSRSSQMLLSDVGDELITHCHAKTTKGKNPGESRLGNYRGRAALETWLYAIAVRYLQDQMRRRSEVIGLSEPVLNSTASLAHDPRQVALSKEAAESGKHYRSRLVETITSALETMPARRRLAAVLRWANGFRPAEIADRMGVSRPRISELLAQARDDLMSATSALCQEIAIETGTEVSSVQTLLADQLETVLEKNV